MTRADKVLAYTTIQVVRDGPVDWLTLNRPDRLNALNGVMVRELWAYFGDLQTNYACRIVVLRGAGAAFCAGLDLKSSEDPDHQLPPPLDAPEASLSGVVRRMRSCPQAIVSLVHGAACGGGLILALASDIRIAGESARMNVAFVKLGLSGCELGTSYFLPRSLGLSVAAELMMTGRFIHADRALATGLVSQVTADEDLTKAADALVSDMLQTSPLGLRKTKETLVLASRLNDLDAVMQLEEHAQLLCLRGPDFAEATAAFMEKRQPDFGP